MNLEGFVDQLDLIRAETATQEQLGELLFAYLCALVSVGKNMVLFITYTHNNQEDNSGYNL